MSNQTNGGFRIGKYLVDRFHVLGKGATGYVYRGINMETHSSVAVKAIDMSEVQNEVTKYLLEGQKKALKTIKNPYIVEGYDVIEEKDFCYIVMEECSKGTLKDYISQRGHLPSDQALEIFRKIVIGYTSVIDSLFIHRDLKTANIMLRANGQPAIIDFGYCQMIMGKRPMIQYNVGSPSYMSPEAYSKSRYSQKSDVWALGAILHEMLTGTTLDQGIETKKFFKDIDINGKVNYNTQGMNQTCKQLLQMSLAVNVEQRGTIHKLKYIIDKSLIPQMKNHMKKIYRDSNPVIEQKNMPAPKFNFGPQSPSYQNIPLVKNITTKQQQQQHHQQHFVRPVSNIKKNQQNIMNKKPIIPCPKKQIYLNYHPEVQKNQKSLIYINQNAHPSSPHHPHALLRRSVDMNSKNMCSMRKINSFKEVEVKYFSKKGQEHPIAPSLRII